MNLNDLKKVIPFHWKIQSFNKDKTKASCVAYIDARDVMDLLDEVVWPENWQDDYKVVKDKLIAWIWIKCWDNWIWKYDTWTEANTEAEKSENSDAFKRAWVKWWIWRFLYKQNIVWVSINQYKQPIDKDGKVLQTKEFQAYCNKLNDYFNSLNN